MVESPDGSNSKQPNYIKLYLYECFEAFVAISILRLALEKPFNFPQVIKASLIIGVLTFLLEQYDPDFKQNVRQGITFTVGSQVVNAFS
jgi:uncharacterized membrane protein YjjP (DUF1212 family)